MTSRATDPSDSAIHVFRFVRGFVLVLSLALVYSVGLLVLKHPIIVALALLIAICSYVAGLIVQDVFMPI